MSGFKNRCLLSHSPSSQRAQDQSVGTSVSVWGLSPCLANGHLLTEFSHGLSSVHTHPRCLCAPKFPLFIRTPVKLDYNQSEWLYFNLIIALKTLSWNPGTFWVIVQGIVWMWELEHKEGWAPKSWCFWTVVLEKTLESPLGCREIQPVNPKGNQSWIFIGRMDAEGETPILWPFDAKNWLIRKDPDAGKDWRQEKKGMTENEMVAWHHWVNGHEFEQTPEDGEEQTRLACCSPWGCKGTDVAEWLNNN